MIGMSEGLLMAEVGNGRRVVVGVNEHLLVVEPIWELLTSVWIAGLKPVSHLMCTEAIYVRGVQVGLGWNVPSRFPCLAGQTINDALIGILFFNGRLMLIGDGLHLLIGDRLVLFICMRRLFLLGNVRVVLGVKGGLKDGDD